MTVFFFLRLRADIFQLMTVFVLTIFERRSYLKVPLGTASVALGITVWLFPLSMNTCQNSN